MTQEAIEISTTPPLPGLKLVQDVNKALQTIATDFAGPTDPAGLPGCVPYCTWADTGNMLLKRRNAANTGWEVEGELFVRTANRNGDGTQNFDVASLNGAQLAGFRNKILNGRFNVNQKGAASRISAANAYNYDQWYYDGTYLYQPIPAEDVYDGVYTLSWEGGSSAAWSLNNAGSSAQGGQSYTAVGNGEQITVSGHTNQHLWVRFQGDLLNLNKVQLEPGNYATVYEERPYSDELMRCQYYLPVIQTYGASSVWGTGFCTDAGVASGVIHFPLQVKPRTRPTGLLVSFSLSNLSVQTGGSISTNVFGLSFATSNTNTVRANVSWSGGAIAVRDPIELITGPATGWIIFTGCQI